MIECDVIIGLPSTTIPNRNSPSGSYFQHVASSRACGVQVGSKLRSNVKRPERS